MGGEVIDISRAEKGKMVVLHMGLSTIQAPAGQVEATKQAAAQALAVSGVPDNDHTLISAAVR